MINVVSNFDFTEFSGFVDSGKLLNYSENRAKYISKGKGASYTDAVRKIDGFILNPVVCIMFCM